MAASVKAPVGAITRTPRLMHRSALDGAYTPLSHYCSRYYVNSALYPVIGLLERTAGFAEHAPTERLARLQALVGPRHRPAREGGALDRRSPRHRTGRTLPSPQPDAAAKEAATFEILLEQLEGLAALAASDL